MAMLNELQRIFKETWGAFRSELGKREPEDEVAELLGLMRKEMVNARSQLSELEETVQESRRALAKEESALADAERRGTLAERIGDEETARIAEEFATRHRSRVDILRAKLESATAERDFQRHDVEQMSERYKLADRNRFVLVSEVRRRRAADTIGGVMNDDAGAFGDFARMQETVERTEAEADAAEQLDREASGPAGTGSRQADVDERLRALKRRMGKG